MQLDENLELNPRGNFGQPIFSKDLLYVTKLKNILLNFSYPDKSLTLFQD